MASSSYVPDGAQEALLALMTMVHPCPLPKGRKLAASGCSFTKVCSGETQTVGSTVLLDSRRSINRLVRRRVGSSSMHDARLHTQTEHTV